MSEFLILLGTLAITLIGVAVLVHMVSLEDAFVFIGRGAAALVLMLIALCMLRGLWLGVMVPWLSAVFAFLKTVIEWLVIAILGFIALSLIGRIVLRRTGRYLPLRRDPQNGDSYAIHDSQEERD